MSSKILIILTLIAWGQNSQGSQIKFSGEAARNLYVCDMNAELNCWYALGKSYCELETEAQVVIESSVLAIHGFAATRIYEIIRDCSDEDTINPYYYGFHGIGCYYDQKLEIHCMLNIEHCWNKEEKASANDRLPTTKMLEFKNYKAAKSLKRSHKKSWPTLKKSRS